MTRLGTFPKTREVCTIDWLHGECLRLDDFRDIFYQERKRNLSFASKNWSTSSFVLSLPIKKCLPYSLSLFSLFSFLSHVQANEMARLTSDPYHLDGGDKRTREVEPFRKCVAARFPGLMPAFFSCRLFSLDAFVFVKWNAIYPWKWIERRVFNCR